MRKITINGKEISDKPYVIAEIGCNHCGQFEIAKELVHAAADCGADAVKFQRRYPEMLFCRGELEKPYNSPHSYGKTYGEHRKALDWFGGYEFALLRTEAINHGLDFIVTPFSAYDAEVVKDLSVHAIKIASCDLKNTVMLKQVSHFQKPVLLSTGGGTLEDIKRAADILQNRVEFAILHCVSGYPVGDAELNLNNIVTLRHEFEQIIGFSSHHPGLMPHFLAYSLGARIFEAHFTLNRGWKGTDHGFSLEPEGLRHLCADLRRINAMLGSFDRPSEDVNEGFPRKFGKSWYATRFIEAGTIIGDDLIELLAPADGFYPFEQISIVGRRVKRNIDVAEVIKRTDLED